MRKKGRTKRSYDMWLPVSLLLVLTALAYVRLWTIGFVSVDDPAYVTQNPHVLDGITKASVHWAFTGVHSANWHPITWLSHLLDVELYGLHSLGHHLTSLLFHVANVLLLFLIMLGLTKERWRSAFVAALFAAHPLHVESVAWVAERKDVLSTFFCFLTLLAYVVYVRQPSTRRYLAVFAALALGLMAKPMLVSVPLILLMLDYWPLGRKLGWALVREKLPLFALALASCVATFIVQRQGGAVQDLAQYPLGVRLANGAVATVAYLVKMVYPTRLAVLYPHPGTGLPVWEVVASVALLAAITYLVIRYARRVPYAAVGWMWYLVTLLPVIGLVQVGKQAMADRYTYIPLTGIFVAITWFAADAAQRLNERTRRMVLVGPGLALIAALAVLTFLQTGYWRDGVTLFRKAVQVSPRDYMVRYCLADAYLEEHDRKQAIIELRETLRLKPDAASVRDVLGFALAKEGQTKEGTRQIRRALRLNPKLASGWNNLGGILLQQGRTDESIRVLKKAVGLNPGYAQAQLNLGAAFERNGQLDEAEKCFQAALKADPRFISALRALGSLRFREQSFREAEDYLREAARLDPKQPDIQLDLAVVLVHQGESGEAMSILTNLIAAKPELAAAHYYLSVALSQRGAYVEAQEELRESVRYGWKPDPLYTEELERRLQR